MPLAIDQVEAMRHLLENWDGYGAATPRADEIDMAIEFLRHCQATIAMPDPYVTPTRAGGVLLAWEFGKHELEVEFDNPDHGSFVYINRETGENATGTLAPRDAWKATTGGDGHPALPTAISI